MVHPGRSGGEGRMSMVHMALLGLLGTAACRAAPSDLDSSFQHIASTLQQPQQPLTHLYQTNFRQQRHHPLLITKHDFQNQRQEKSESAVPAPFTISTGLTVTERREQERREEEGRRGRSFSSYSSGRPARWLGGSLARAVAGAPIVEGVRRPDDESDRVIHRGGRFINNVFVPAGAVAPEEVQVTGGPGLRRSGRSYSQYVEEADYSQLQPEGDYSLYTNHVEPSPRQPSFAFRDFYSGRRQEQADATAMESRQDSVYVPAPQEEEEEDEPVYFLTGDQDSLHADRSPYTFEPANQAHEDELPNVPMSLPSNKDFIIKQHTYQMCPTCPTFSIPIPVPRAAAASVDQRVSNPYSSEPGLEYQQSADPSLFSRLSSWLSPLLASARSSLSSMLPPSSSSSLSSLLTDTNSIDSSTFSDRLSTVPGSPDSAPLLMAGVAVAGLGAAALLSSGLQLLSLGGGSGRAFGGGDEGNSIGEQTIQDYNIQDLLCMPRVYCEKMKRRKHVIDQYPNTKKVATWLVGRLFNGDTVYSSPEEEPIYNKCNLRECLLSLLD